MTKQHKEGDVVCYSLKDGYWKRETDVVFWLHSSVVVGVWKIKKLKK